MIQLLFQLIGQIGGNPCLEGPLQRSVLQSRFQTGRLVGAQIGTSAVFPAGPVNLHSAFGRSNHPEHFLFRTDAAAADTLSQFFSLVILHDPLGFFFRSRFLIVRRFFVISLVFGVFFFVFFFVVFAVLIEIIGEQIVEFTGFTGLCL